MPFYLRLLVAIAVLSSFEAHSQVQETVPKTRPIPPNAAAMFKVLERPLGSFTGTIPISFPLATVGSGPLSASVALNYNSTGGIRVEELSGCAGLGFSLQDGGGRITQMVRGPKPDDIYGILNNTLLKPSQFDPYNMGHVQMAADGWIDLEPDVYMYSFNGRSGKFHLNENGGVMLIDPGGIKLTYSINNTVTPIGITSWILTDENGTRYFFGKRTMNYSYHSGNYGSTIQSLSSQTWYLDSIVDLNSQHAIRFTYGVSGTNWFTTFSGQYLPLNASGTFCNGFNTLPDVVSVTTSAGESVVSRIDAGSGYITFTTAADYTHGPQKLLSMQLYDSTGAYNGQYKFYYGTNFSENRWKLSGFSKFGTSGTDSLTHKFEYETSEGLPGVFSANVDIWGFYNGQGNNTWLPDYIYNNGGYKQVQEAFSYRHANGSYAQAGILKKIIYPTGGYRQFVYEGNKVLPSGDFFTMHPYPAYMANRSFTETVFNYMGPTMPSMKRLFTVNSTYGISKFSYLLNNVGVLCNGYSVKIYKLINPGDLTGGNLITTFTGQVSGNFILDNGYYRADVFVNSGCTIGSLYGSWQEGTFTSTTITTPQGTFPKREYNAGGVRIKEIRDFDPVSGKTLTTEYRYKLYSTDSTYTSGLLTTPVWLTSWENIQAALCYYAKLSPGSSYPLASEQGSYVVYPEVRTIESGNGWNDQLFNYVQDVPDYGGFPQGPTADAGDMRGRLVQEKIYDSAGRLLKKVINTWSGTGLATPPGTRVKPYYDTEYNGLNMYRESRPDQFTPPTLAAINDYYPGGYARALQQTIDSVFTTSGTIVNKTDFKYYFYNSSYLLKQKISYRNGNKTRELTFKYPFNNNNEFSLGLTAAEQTMKTTLLTNNFIQPIEEVDTLKTNGAGGVFMNGTKLIFNQFNGNKVYAWKVRKFTAATDSTETIFSAYDNRGNVIEQYSTSSPKEVFLYGYKGLYPVAYVIGSDHATVSALVNAGILNNPASDAALRTELNKIRTGLAGSPAQVTTYTYSTLFRQMTSATGPDGILMLYEYDGFGRLLHIKDANGNILKRTNYSIVNPQ